MWSCAPRGNARTRHRHRHRRTWPPARPPTRICPRVRARPLVHYIAALISIVLYALVFVCAVDLFTHARTLTYAYTHAFSVPLSDEKTPYVYTVQSPPSPPVVYVWRAIRTHPAYDGEIVGREKQKLYICFEDPSVFLRRSGSAEFFFRFKYYTSVSVESIHRESGEHKNASDEGDASHCSPPPSPKRSHIAVATELVGITPRRQYRQR